ncbi:hypothetical protein [Methanobacterium paludis]|uniref:hypothetical protein n=1 Tax=Methanobacterium paludis (strain DSM 25820 / JCM 18151 / SWAN1) TaxID=868131 RepID=UPI00187D4EF5|nr:hypothetical protein [Methanobacterium paludis]
MVTYICCGIFCRESKSKWDVADSCVSYYEDAGAECFEVKNLQQLSDLISEI